MINITKILGSMFQLLFYFVIGNKWKKSKILKSRKIKDVMLPISNKSGNNNRMLPSEIAQQNMRYYVTFLYSDKFC